MAERQKQINKQVTNVKPSLPNPMYDKLTRRINALMKSRVELGTQGLYRPSDLQKEMRKLLSARKKIKSDFPNPQYRRLEYVRYADD